MNQSESIRRRSLAKLRWVVNHTADAALVLVFGILLALPTTGIGAILAEGPYKIYLLANRYTDAETLEEFRAAERGWRDQDYIRDIPVETRLVFLDDVNSAQEQAENLANRPDALLVIGHLPSQALEASLPTYLSATPPVPVIATTATSNNLLVGCARPKCFDQDGFAPLLQLSPDNTAQAMSAVKFATMKGKRRFLIVSVEDPSNHSYYDEMVRSYSEAVFRAVQESHAMLVGVRKTFPPDFDLRNMGVDCILYAGDVDGARALFDVVSKMRNPDTMPLIVFSDSVIGSDLRAFAAHPSSSPSVAFMSAMSAYDYNLHTNTSVRDALAISSELLSDLKERGGNLPFRLYSLLHVESVADARKSLIQVMKTNAASRSWYRGQNGTLYVFGGDKFAGQRRANGGFHVLQLVAFSAEMMEAGGFSQDAPNE